MDMDITAKPLTTMNGDTSIVVATEVFSEVYEGFADLVEALDYGPVYVTKLIRSGAFNAPGTPIMHKQFLNLVMQAAEMLANFGENVIVFVDNEMDSVKSDIIHSIPVLLPNVFVIQCDLCNCTAVDILGCVGALNEKIGKKSIPS